MNAENKVFFGVQKAFEQRTSVFIWRIDMLSGFFDEQFVPNTNKDTLRRDLYQRFIPKGFPDQEVEDLLLNMNCSAKNCA